MSRFNLKTRPARIGAAVIATAAATLALAASPAQAATTSGPESFTGFLVTTGVSGERVELASNIHARGVFDGVGKIVELPSQPGDPENKDRDDLVFPQGTLHLFSFVQEFQIVSFDPNSCRVALTVTDTEQFAGGTGIFAGASGTGTGTGTASGLAQRNPDGSCSLELLPKHELDSVSVSGILNLTF